MTIIIGQASKMLWKTMLSTRPWVCDWQRFVRTELSDTPQRERRPVLLHQIFRRLRSHWRSHGGSERHPGIAEIEFQDKSQWTSSDDMIWSVKQIIVHLSRGTTLKERN
jgi:hypothetical protein